MELKYVQPGEKVTAQSYNNVVDAIFAGVNSSEGFQNTANGAVVYPRAQLTASYQSGAWRTMFQVKTAQYWKQTARGQWNPPNMHNTVMIDLGPDAATCKSNISIMGQNVKEAGIVVGESPSMDCLLQDSVYVNASQKKTSWIDLGIDVSSTDFIAADAFKCIKEEGVGDNKKKVTNYYLVVTDKSENDVIDRAKQLFSITDEPFELVKRFMLAKKGQVGRLDESKVFVQSHTGAILWSMPAPANAEPWEVITSLSGYPINNPVFQIGTQQFKCEAFEDENYQIHTLKEISSDFLSAKAGCANYCVIDVPRLSAFHTYDLPDHPLSASPNVNAAFTVKIKVFDFDTSGLSGLSGEARNLGLIYYDRNPIVPCWQVYPY